ncbi:Integral membrane protein CcmA involved in cell shape determination [Methylophaga frappieri]|uniref:Integral membrane protein CcmA involved in cell shape determination n=1 Tax=Methylophaga frappieri (strain ATCC BAA-2434 / DSM 25690 / JAM7) TaxID=754477 RepID=I1YJ77_METFJ|nr:polymer-forming cytoskeletal protein [Methylophaga frappieri]AFJ02970.1 Integral membrane protein CcmA involved in cell shape determination [Methylophaga frappieri]
MFGKQKKRKAAKATRIDTLIGENTHIQGDIHFSGGLRIDGAVTGNIIADENEASLLTLSEKGRITGEIRVPHQLINGRISGHVYASEHIELAGAAQINGDVFYHLLEMAMGAEVNGQLVHVAQDDDILTVSHEDNSHDEQNLHLGNTPETPPKS